MYKTISLQRRVNVWGTPYDVTVTNQSKTVWIATGVYMGQSLEVKGRSANSALAAWRDAARYRGN